MTFVAGGNGDVAPLSVLSDENGFASAGSWTLSSTAGINTAFAFISGTSVSLAFTATGVSDNIAVSLAVASGLNSSATVGTSVTDRIDGHGL